MTYDKDLRPYVRKEFENLNQEEINKLSKRNQVKYREYKKQMRLANLIFKGLRNGNNVAEISKALDINRNTVYDYINRYNYKGNIVKY